MASSFFGRAWRGKPGSTACLRRVAPNAPAQWRRQIGREVWPPPQPSVAAMSFAGLLLEFPWFSYSINCGETLQISSLTRDRCNVYTNNAVRMRVHCGLKSKFRHLPQGFPDLLCVPCLPLRSVRWSEVNRFASPPNPSHEVPWPSRALNPVGDGTLLYSTRNQS